ncbi:MAG: ribbon-helix-helix domain-containing protein [Candidatus Bathyarchaeota archaeon]|nr:ribbon-helix-helix domain-containing protein [Candidatus Bathyarchaeota archaeon]
MVDDKKRLTLTLTKVYVETLDYLVDKGFYMEHQDAIRAALRLLFRHHKIEPFRSGLVEEIEKIQE